MFLPATITLKFGDSGDFVTELQRRLVAVNCFQSGQINGSYDGNTVNAVRHFQGMQGLNADGVAGPETLRRLSGVIAGDTSSGGAPADARKDEPLLEPAAATSMFVWGAQPVEPNPFIEPVKEEHAAFEYKPEEPRIEPTQPPTQNPFESTAPSPQDMAMFAPAQPLIPPEHETSYQSPHERPAFGAKPLAPSEPVASPQAALATEETPAKAPSLMDRAKQVVSAARQKISEYADYFKATLKPDVLQEVHEIGQQMLQKGVKEVPIPGAATEPTRTTELPGRTQEPIKIR